MGFKFERSYQNFKLNVILGLILTSQYNPL